MHKYFADFHIHVGRAKGKPVKIAAGASLTLENLLYQSAFVKGLDIITVIDGVCDNVLEELEELVEQKELTPVTPGGGLMYRDKLLVILGAEVEIKGPTRGAAHFGCWFPDVTAAKGFNGWLKTVQKNTQLSSQRAWASVEELEHETHERDGLFIVHHAFTPFKGMIGACVDRIEDFLDPAHVDALELGLSSDTDMADCIRELHTLTFLSNSDAHGTKTIAREYNQVEMDGLSFDEVKKVLHREDGRRVVANFGLHPQQGKYFRSRCRRCDDLIGEDNLCTCGKAGQHVFGVWDRLQQIRDLPQPAHPSFRPPYYHRIPLQDIPGVGPTAYRRLLEAFGSELAVWAQASKASLVDVVGKQLASQIDKAMRGEITWIVGGAGTYGKAQVSNES